MLNSPACIDELHGSPVFPGDQADQFRGRPVFSASGQSMAAWVGGGESALSLRGIRSTRGIRPTEPSPGTRRGRYECGRKSSRWNETLNSRGIEASIAFSCPSGGAVGPAFSFACPGKDTPFVHESPSPFEFPPETWTSSCGNAISIPASPNFLSIIVCRSVMTPSRLSRLGR